MIVEDTIISCKVWNEAGETKKCIHIKAIGKSGLESKLTTLLDILDQNHISILPPMLITIFIYNKKILLFEYRQYVFFSNHTKKGIPKKEIQLISS